MRRAAAAVRPVVVEVGSSSLTTEGGLDGQAVAGIVDQIAGLWTAPIQAVPVTSGRRLRSGS